MTRDLFALKGDLFGGFAAMLVAFPSAIAFGLIAMAPLGAEHSAQGALAGILGAIALGTVTPLLGGAPRLISAPCAPAAAMLAAFSTDFVHGGITDPAAILAFLGFTAAMAGLMQVALGLAGGGRFIKYIPYPVVAGYMSGVGVLIALSQLPKALGVEGPLGWATLLAPEAWSGPAVIVTVVSMVLMAIAPRFARAVPAAIVALLGGMAAYGVLAIFHPELATVRANPLVIGVPAGAAEGVSPAVLIGAVETHWSGLAGLTAADLGRVLVPALMLATLLSIDTLKTCVVMDAITRSRHQSNRELIGQGAGNLCAAALGGMPGAGTMGATLVNLNSGGQSRASGVLAGVFSLAAALLLGRYIAWVPLASLAGILIVIAFKLVDWHSLRLVRQRSTLFDFVVIASVTGTAIAFNLIAAAGAGVVLAILLFVRDQIRGSVVRRMALGNQIFSKHQRLPTERSILESQGRATVVLELQGNLFFGTTDQLFSEIEPQLSDCRHLVLDLRRVHSIDFTAAHLLEQIAARLSDQQGFLVFTGLHTHLPGGMELGDYFSQLGLVRQSLNIRIFEALEDALEWTEERVLAEAGCWEEDEAPLALNQFFLFADLSTETLADLAPAVQTMRFAADTRIFSAGAPGDEMFLIRRGHVHIVLPLRGGGIYHLASFGRGDFFGDMAFLDKGKRSADAIAGAPVDLFAISRADFDEVVRQHPRLEGLVFARLARALALRLRQTNTDLRALEET